MGIYDIGIIGGGTAGMTAAIYGQRAGKQTVLFEGTTFGGQITSSPNVENYPGIASVSGSEFSMNLMDQAVKLGTQTIMEQVTGIREEADYKVIVTTEKEYECKSIILATGVTHRHLGVPGEERLTGAGVCNMAVEAGAKTGIFEADEKAMEYLKEHGREPKAVFHSDPDAHYIREYTIDLSKVEPVVAKPDFVDNLSPAKEVRGIKIDEAFLGSCNNGRIEDLRVGAEVIKGKKVADKVRFLVVPASQTIYRQALKEGLLDIFMEAGAIVMNPNCSVCWGSCQGVIGENEVLISTGTRNFKGRAGHPSSKVYLGSAATVTASAIKGEIALASDL